MFPPHLQIQLRFAPALAKKPKSGEDEADKQAKAKDKDSGRREDAAPSKPFDPFADPLPALLVVPSIGGSDGDGDGGGTAAGKPTHRLVLNKFAISQDHSILATAAFRPQTHLLDAADLAAAYACIEAYHEHRQQATSTAGEDLFVFYNSGRHSGASQPHRHLQLLPVARMREGLDASAKNDEDDDADAGGGGWDVLVDRLAEGRGDGLPFYVATAQLPVAETDDGAPVTPAFLHSTYLRLYRQACAAAEGTSAVIAETDAGGTNGGNNTVFDTAAEERGEVPARISYNLALTRRTMAVMPRTAEGSAVVTAADGDGGRLSLNGTVLAGTALVKNEAEWEALRKEPSRLAAVLAQIGVPARRTAAL